MRLSNLLNLALIKAKASPKCEHIARYLSTSCPWTKSNRTANRHHFLGPSSSSSNETSFRVVEGDDSYLKELQPAGSNVELSDLVCHLPGQREFALNLTWLRDSCHCEKCTHKFSRQRLFTPKDFKRDLFVIKDIGLVSGLGHQEFTFPHVSNKSNDTHLKVIWTDGHESFYSIDWLSKMNNLYEKQQLRLGTHEDSPRHLLLSDDFYAPMTGNYSKPEYWNVSLIQANLKPVNYRDLLDGFQFHDDEPNFINANRISAMSYGRSNSMLSLTDQLTRYGMAKIVNVPQERNQVLKVARSLAYERPTGYGTVFDVVIEPSEEINLAYSSEEFDLHTDLTYRETSPGVQLLHCIRNSVEGGLSFFSDAFKAAHLLKCESPKLFHVLVQFPAIFVVRDPYRDVKFRRQMPILSLDYAGDLKEVYYSPFMLPPMGHKDDLKLFYLAQDRFTQLLQDTANKYITKMNPGDLFIFNNRRVLHGRSSYDPKTSNRFLQGCYMDWDEIICLHEKFRSNNNKGR